MRNSCSKNKEHKLREILFDFRGMSFPRRRETTFGGANPIIIRTFLLEIPACAGMAGLAAALLLCCLVGCDKDPVEQVEATGIKATADTVCVAYGGTVDLSALFSIDPAGASGSLMYSISRQPEYVEGNDAEYTEVEAYSVSGNTLASADVRVPDAFVRSDASRTVREGKLKITLEGSSEAESVSGFVRIKLANGEEKPVTDFSSTHSFTRVSGYYSQTQPGTNDVYTAGSGKFYPDEDAESPWREGNLKLNNPDLPAGTEVRFKAAFPFEETLFLSVYMLFIFYSCQNKHN